MSSGARAGPRAGGMPALAAACVAASLANPYGISLHRHIAGYLTSDWIRNAVDEFQSPRFRSENLMHFEAAAARGAAAWPDRWMTRGRVADALLVLFWAHLALGSVRHVPLFAIVSAPLVAAELSRLWERRAAAWPPRSVGRILWTLGDDLAASFGRLSVWSAMLAAAVIAADSSQPMAQGFPRVQVPGVTDPSRA